MISKIKNLLMIIEQGTSGIWHYRKWSDGTAECWGTMVTGNISVSALSGFYGGTSACDAFPTDLFITKPQVFVNCETWGSGYHLAYAYNVTKDRCRLGGIRNDGNSSPMTANIHAIGKWK